jgi:hypothetical protein
MSPEKKFKRQFRDNYTGVHSYLDPLMELAATDEVLAWAVFAQSCNMVTMIAYNLSRGNEDAAVKLISDAVNKSLEIARPFKK